jgi:hypothetical protein
MLSPLAQVTGRIDGAREDSDVAYFYELLYGGEMATKLATAALVACLEEDRERHRYRVEFDLVRADGLGAWSSALDDCLTGPASQVLAEDARRFQRELTQNFPRDGPEWQAKAVSLLHEARLGIDADLDEPLPARVSARRWFADFAALRNRTRGHGATKPAACSRACGPLHRSIDLVLGNLTLFLIPWVHLRRNLSGKYRVVDIGNGTDHFNHLRSSREHSLLDGVYCWAGGARPVVLLSADEDVRDFYLPNGGFKGQRYELLSYITDSRVAVPNDNYVNPPTALPDSETQGVGELEVVGTTFANLPPRVRGYVQRGSLEGDLTAVLVNDRHPVVTLVGRGGIGKTSLALEVLHAIAESERFFAEVWFSARDIELLPEGPKLVRPHVLSPDDMAREYVSLLQPPERNEKSFKSLDFFSRALGAADDGATLFVFDNFETVRSPLELYRWLDTYIRLPNKVLITTRSRDFKGDYWVEVGGMTEDEFESLVQSTAADLGITELIDNAYISELYRESDGHPYIAKVLLGEIARAGERQKVARIMASQDRVLEALFERTFSQLAPAAQRVFLTLSSWRSLVPLVALEAAVNRPENERLDVDVAVDELRRSSLLETTVTEESDVYLNVPLSAALFGQRKLPTSAWKSAIEADSEVLRLFGPMQATGTRHGFAAQVHRLFQSVAERLQKRPEEFERYKPVLEFVAREQPMGWLLLAELLEEHRPSDDWPEEVASAYRSYLESVPNDGQIWRMLAAICRHQEDYLGSIHALIARARLPEAPYADVSYAATRVNAHLHDGVLELDTDEKRILVGSLVSIMEARRAEADATDLSRLAWLLMNIKRTRDAKEVVRDGMDLDPNNPHCQRLATRLHVETAA